MQLGLGISFHLNLFKYEYESQIHNVFAYILFCDVSHLSYHNFYHNLSPLCDSVEGTEWFQNLGIFTLDELLEIDKNICLLGGAFLLSKGRDSR